MTGVPTGWTFRKSSFTTDDKCVEVASDSAQFVALRDSKDPNGPVLTGLGRLAIGQFIAMVKADSVG